MMKTRWAAIALLSLAALARAGTPVRNTAPYVPTQSIGYGAVGSDFTPVTNASPLPVSVVSGGGGASEANPGSNATKATAVQGVTGGKPIGVFSGRNYVGSDSASFNMQAFFRTDTDDFYAPLSTVGNYFDGTGLYQVRGNAKGAFVQGSVADGATGGGNPVIIAGVDASGKAQQLLTDTPGVLAPPIAGTANRVITKTSVSATTSTQICPTASAPVSTEIQTSIGNVGLGLNGQALTSATLGTTTADADIVIPVAFTVYQPPVAPTNAITAYSASAFVAVCIQTIRQ